jgi:hypothetical protein
VRVRGSRDSDHHNSLPSVLLSPAHSIAWGTRVSVVLGRSFVFFLNRPKMRVLGVSLLVLLSLVSICFAKLTEPTDFGTKLCKNWPTFTLQDYNPSSRATYLQSYGLVRLDRSSSHSTALFCCTLGRHTTPSRGYHRRSLLCRFKYFTASDPVPRESVLFATQGGWCAFFCGCFSWYKLVSTRLVRI